MSKFLLILLGVVLFLAYIPFGFTIILMRCVLEILDAINSSFDAAFDVIIDMLGANNDL